MADYNLEYIDEKSRRLIEKGKARDHQTKRSLGCEHCAGGIVLPIRVRGKYDVQGCVLRADGTVVRESVWSSDMHGDYEYGEAKTDDCRVIYISIMYPIWGHVLTDGIKRLWYLHTEECRRLLAQGYKLAMTWYPDIRLQPNVVRVLELSGINLGDVVRVTEPTRFADVVVPDCCWGQDEQGVMWYTEEYINLIRRIKEAAVDDGSVAHPERVYLTRARYASAKDYGEKSVERAFEKAGFAIVAPETLTLDQQIEVVRHARCIATTEGSIAHNMIFRDEGSECVIVRKANYINEWQMALNERLMGKLTYIDAHRSVLASSRMAQDGPFYMYASRHLLRYLGQESDYKSWLLDKEYYRYLTQASPVWVHTRNLWIFTFSSWRDKLTIVRNKWHTLRYR